MWSRESVWVLPKNLAASLPFGGSEAQGRVVGEAGGEMCARDDRDARFQDDRDDRDARNDSLCVGVSP